MNTLNALVTFVLILAQLGHPEPIFPNPADFAKIDSCPLVLGISGKSPYVFYENSSRNSVIAVQFGCARKRDSGFLVVKEYQLERFDRALKSGESATYKAGDMDSKIAPCLKINSKLAIVLVQFADGGTWLVPSASKESSAPGSSPQGDWQ